MISSWICDDPSIDFDGDCHHVQITFSSDGQETAAGARVHRPPTSHSAAAPLAFDFDRDPINIDFDRDLCNKKGQHYLGKMTLACKKGWRTRVHNNKMEAMLTAQGQLLR